MLEHGWRECKLFGIPLFPPSLDNTRIEKKKEIKMSVRPSTHPFSRKSYETHNPASLSTSRRPPI